MGKYDFELNLVYPDSVLKILEQIHTDSTVLEFGPANGRMTKYMKEALHCKVYLAELDEEAGREALQYGEDLVVGDIENYEWYERYRDIRFDYILFADVLEHLRNPLEVLIKSKMLLKADGSILLSVPNFAHNSVLVNLLNNEFDYRDIGLLDNTHIHMFTKNSLEKMLSQAYLYPVKKMATYLDATKTEIPTDLDSVKGIDRSFWIHRPYGEVYQFVYQVKKESEWSEKLEYECKSVLNPDTIKVYRDNGSGYSEEYITVQYIYDYDAENRIIVSLEPDEEVFRIDPVERSGIIRLVSCVGISGESRIDLEVIGHNAMLVNEDVYFFETIDPQWQIRIPKNSAITQVEAVISYISLSDPKTVRMIGDSLIRSEETKIRQRTEAAIIDEKRKMQEWEKQLESKELDKQKRIDELRIVEEDCLRTIREQQESEAHLKKQLLVKEEALDELRNEIKLYQDQEQSSQQRIQSLEEILDQKDSVIQSIYDSNTWKLNRKINHLMGRKI